MSGADFRTVARVGDVAEGSGLACEVGGRAIALFRDGGEYYALDDQCPHRGVPLCDGPVYGGAVTCTWHGWRFSLADGGWLDNPHVRVATHAVRVVGDAIQVALSVSDG